MKTTINNSDFHDAFRKMNRENNFSYDGLNSLFNYFEQYEEETGEEIEIDVIAICCEYSEYENISEFNYDYGKECETIEDIEELTQVIKIGNTNHFIIQSF